MNIPEIRLQTGRLIGKGRPAYLIAEIGSNHDGDLARAQHLIRSAAQAGADAVKFQSFLAGGLVNPLCKKEGEWGPEPAYSLLETLSLPREWHIILQQTAAEASIDFLSTPFDLERLDWLLELDVPALKIASGDLTYYELLRAAGKSGKPIILSTGHALLGEVEAALSVLWESGCKDIVLLQCASLYPSGHSDANIRAMVSMQQGFQVQVGYSDHTPGSVVPLGAISLGACVIEKHFTDDKTRSGPDHSVAMDGAEFSLMVNQIRQLESALGTGKKSYRPDEEEERVMARRAVYAACDIAKGDPITRSQVRIVRHCYRGGIPANHWHALEGKIAMKQIKRDELITWEMV